MAANLSAAQLATIERLANGLNTAAQIAARAECSVQAIRDKCKLHGWNLPDARRLNGGNTNQGSPWTEERTERLKALWTDGHSASQIASLLGGVTRNAVISKVHRIGLAGADRPHRSVQRARARPPKLPAPRQTVPRPPPIDAPEPLRLTALQLTDRTCKWPVTDLPPHAFCGHAVNGDGPPYCPFHRAMSVGNVPPPRDAESEARRIAAVKRAHAKRRRAS